MVGMTVNAKTIVKSDVPLRVLGSVLVILGWFVVLNVSVSIGGAMSALGDCMAIPFFVRTKAWDVVVMVCVLHVVTISKLAQGLFT